MKKLMILSLMVWLVAGPGCVSTADKWTPVRVKAVQDQLDKISVSTSYNAFISVNEQAAAQVSGTAGSTLQGMTLAIKDNIDVAGLPTTAGTAALSKHVPTASASVVDRLLQAGAIVIGKTNMHELAFGITSNNATFGPVKNAVNNNYLPGGSSGGTGVAIALGLADAGLGSDTGGSSRIPAALNGIVGFRPSTGRYANDGIVMISNTRDTVGPMGKTVADVAVLDAVMAGADNELTKVDLSTVRVGVPEEYFYENLDPDVARVAKSALDQMEAAGVTLVRANLPKVEELNAIGFPVVFYETARMLPEYLDGVAGVSMDDLQAGIASPDVQGAIAMIMGGPVTDEQYQQAISVVRPQLQQMYADYFAAHNVSAVIYPTTPLPARLRQGSDETVELNGAQVPTFPTYIRNVDPSSNAGIPSVTIPAGRSKKGMPIGMAIDGPVNQDRALLALAAALEAL